MDPIVRVREKKLERLKPAQKREDRGKPSIPSDLYQVFLNYDVEAVLENGKTVRGRLTGISKYALLIEESNGLTIINKAYLVEVKQVKA
jgi:small nuclear ribonucleoprotein (snRNP)-like protein